MSEERGFEVVDRRRTAQAGGTEPAGTGAAPRDEPPAAEEERREAQAAEEDGEEEEPFDFNPLAGLTVSGILRMAAGMLGDRAWASMGLVADPATGQVTKNLPEARRAIDALGDLARHIEADASPEEKRELQVMLTNLRMNFVRQSGA